MRQAGASPPKSTQIQKVLRPQPSTRMPPLPIIWELAPSRPGSFPSLRLCARPPPTRFHQEQADARGGARNSILSLSTSPFSLLLLLSCSLPLLPVLPSPSRSPPFPASSRTGPPPPPLLRLPAPSSHPPPPRGARPLPQPISVRPRGATPPGASGRPAEPRPLERRAAPRAGAEGPG